MNGCMYVSRGGARSGPKGGDRGGTRGAPRGGLRGASRGGSTSGSRGLLELPKALFGKVIARNFLIIQE